jgi:hypothetical protein
MGCDGLVPVLDTEVAQCTGHDVDAFRHTAKMGEVVATQALDKNGGRFHGDPLSLAKPLIFKGNISPFRQAEIMTPK